MELAELLAAASTQLTASSLQALGDAARVAARTEDGRAECGKLEALPPVLAAGLRDASLAAAWPSAAGALANLAVDSDANRDAIAAAGGLAALASACAPSAAPSSVDLDRCAAAAFGNIVAGNGACQQAFVDGGCAPVLVRLLASAEPSVLQLAAKALENLGTDAHIVQPLVDAGLIEALSRLVLAAEGGSAAAADGALAGLLRLLGVLPLEASPAKLAARGTLAALASALQLGGATAQLGALALLQLCAPPNAPLADADVAALGDGGLVDALLTVVRSTSGGDQLTAPLGAVSVLRSLSLTPAGGAALWRRSAAAQLTAAVVRATAAIDTESTEGQELLDHARLRLDCLGVLAALANSEERCLAMLSLSLSADAAAAAAEGARVSRAEKLSSGGEPEPEPEQEQELEPAVGVDLAAACVSVFRHKHDLEGSRAAVNILRNLALPAAGVDRLVSAGVLGVFGNAVQHKDVNVGVCGAAGLRIMAAHSTDAALAVCTCTAAEEEGGGSLIESLLQLDLEKTHPHCRVELAWALALVAVATSAQYCNGVGDADASGGGQAAAALQALTSAAGVGFISFLLLAPAPALQKEAMTALLAGRAAAAAPGEIADPLSAEPVISGTEQTVRAALERLKQGGQPEVGEMATRLLQQQ